jgi:hypothetical protein
LNRRRVSVENSDNGESPKYGDKMEETPILAGKGLYIIINDE